MDNIQGSTRDSIGFLSEMAQNNQEDTDTEELTVGLPFLKSVILIN